MYHGQGREVEMVHRAIADTLTSRSLREGLNPLRVRGAGQGGRPRSPGCSQAISRHSRSAATMTRRSG